MRGPVYGQKEEWEEYEGMNPKPIMPEEIYHPDMINQITAFMDPPRGARFIRRNPDFPFFLEYQIQRGRGFLDADGGIQTLFIADKNHPDYARRYDIERNYREDFNNWIAGFPGFGLRQESIPRRKIASRRRTARKTTKSQYVKSRKTRSVSRKRKTASPKRRTASPKRKTASPKRKTASPKRRSTRK